MSASNGANSSPIPSSLFGRNNTPRPSQNAPVVLIFGGGSVLGIEMQRRFSIAGWRCVTLDFYDQSVPCGGVNGCALPKDGKSPISLALPSGAPPRMQVKVATECLNAAGVQKFDAMLDATLGYVTGGIGEDDIFDSIEYMYRTSVESALVAAKLSSKFLSKGGMLAMLGSVAALSPQPKALGFGIAKAAVHQIVRSLAMSVGDELPDDAVVVAIVPEVLDTPLHRSMNGGRVGGHWTPCDAVAEKLLHWATDPESRPPNSSLVSVSTSANSSSIPEHTFRLIQNPSFVQSARL